MKHWLFSRRNRAGAEAWAKWCEAHGFPGSQRLSEDERARNIFMAGFHLGVGAAQEEDE